MREHQFLSQVLPYAPSETTGLHPIDKPGRPIRYVDNILGINFKDHPLRTIPRLFAIYCLCHLSGFPCSGAMCDGAPGGSPCATRQRTQKNQTPITRLGARFRDRPPPSRKQFASFHSPPIWLVSGGPQHDVPRFAQSLREHFTPSSVTWVATPQERPPPPPHGGI